MYKDYILELGGTPVPEGVYGGTFAMNLLREYDEGLYQTILTTDFDPSEDNRKLGAFYGTLQGLWTLAEV